MRMRYGCIASSCSKLADAASTAINLAPVEVRIFELELGHPVSKSCVDVSPRVLRATRWSERALPALRAASPARHNLTGHASSSRRAALARASRATAAGICRPGSPQIGASVRLTCHSITVRSRTSPKWRAHNQTATDRRSPSSTDEGGRLVGDQRADVKVWCSPPTRGRTTGSGGSGI